MKTAVTPLLVFFFQQPVAVTPMGLKYGNLPKSASLVERYGYLLSSTRQSGMGFDSGFREMRFTVP